MKGYGTETVHFQFHVGRAKLHLKSDRFFQFPTICLHLPVVWLQFSKLNTVSQMHFGLHYLC